MNNQIKKDLTNLLLSLGVGDVGFGKDENEQLSGLVSIVVPLSDAVIDEIDSAPTHTYFHHYRTVNAFIDQALLKAGRYLQDNGYRYIPIPASQSVNLNGLNYCGRYSHKKAARLCGMGTIGKNSLFIHKTYGPTVRLGTLLTDCDFGETKPVTDSCLNCNECVKACPAMAITGNEWHVGIQRSEVFDPKACSDYMKKAFSHIGRGAVCGICMKVCAQAHKMKVTEK
jgi:epoxyqueuosine reductase QueG